MIQESDVEEETGGREETSRYIILLSYALEYNIRRHVSIDKVTLLLTFSEMILYSRDTTVNVHSKAYINVSLHDF